MVNLSAILFRKSPLGPKQDSFWRKRQILKMSAHFYGRSRNCFSIAIRRVQRSLQYVVAARQLRKIGTQKMWDRRITSGCQELGYLPEGSPTLLESLQRSDILLNRQSLANIAIWEPRTFKAINKFTAVRAYEDRVRPELLGPVPKGVITRGLLRDRNDE